jgi:hypothetical protein
MQYFWLIFRLNKHFCVGVGGASFKCHVSCVMCH